VQSEKLTPKRQSEPKRSYDDACGTAHALELIGERWAPLVLRELMFGPRRFSGLRADLPGISANVLTQRLSELEERGLVRRSKLPPPASVQVYEATEWGLEAAPVLRALGRWAVRSPRHSTDQFVSPVSIMMSMQTMFDPARAKGFDARLAFCFGERSYVVEVHDGAIDVRQAPPDGAAVVFDVTPNEIAGVLYGGAPLDSVRSTGDAAIAKRFTTLFDFPTKAA
jgi:DNA-binding HxlR family transcriptional regulator